MENENLITVYLKLLGVLECPVCLDYLTKPVAVCNEGHALCSKCKCNVTNCPLCRNPICSTRGLIVDQIIDTLLYPCYKMGCGSLLKRSEAEVHDQTCGLGVASDKQAVLHNNLLKNIEENFASFIVQPDVVKEVPQTRTVGTNTGKVRMMDARIQTSLPFSVTSQGSTLNPDLKGKSSLSTFQHSGGRQSPGTSLSTSLNGLDSSQIETKGENLGMPLIKFKPNSFHLGMSPIHLNSSYSQAFNFNLGPALNASGSWLENPSVSSQPFQFTSLEQNNPASAGPKSKRPSTKLDLNMGQISKLEGSKSNENLQISKSSKLNRPTVGIPCFSTPPATSSDIDGNASQIEGAASLAAMNFFGSGGESSSSRIRPSVLNLNSASLSNLRNINEPIAKKRPSTNLISVTTPAC